MKKKNRGKYLEPGIKVISVSPNRVLCDSGNVQRTINLMSIYGFGENESTQDWEGERLFY